MKIKENYAAFPIFDGILFDFQENILNQAILLLGRTIYKKGWKILMLPFFIFRPRNFRHLVRLKLDQFNEDYFILNDQWKFLKGRDENFKFLSKFLVQGQTIEDHIGASFHF